MKALILYFYLLIFTIVPVGQVFCQSDTALNGISFAKQIIGKPLSSIKDSLFDDYGKFVKNPVLKKNAVTIFSCSPLDKGILYIGSIKFQEVGFVVDTTGIIKGVHFMAGYHSKSPAQDKRLFNSEYKSLVAYMETLLQLSGIRQPFMDEKTYTQEKMIWEKDLLKYILTNQQSKKIKQVRPHYDIILEIFN